MNGEVHEKVQSRSHSSEQTQNNINVDKISRSPHSSENQVQRNSPEPNGMENNGFDVERKEIVSDNKELSKEEFIPPALSPMFSRMQDAHSLDSTDGMDCDYVLVSATNKDPENGEMEEETLLLEKLDRYGFLISDDNSTGMGAVSLARTRQSYVVQQETAKQRRERIRLENLRFEKWLKFAESEESVKTEIKQHSSRFKRRIRKGIPDPFRQRLWPMLCGSICEQRSNLDEYQKLLSNSYHDKSLERVHESISRDVGRTFPRHVFFLKANGVGQQSLGNILRAYSMVDKEVGYCQGIGFIAGLLLGYLGEEESFWLMRTLMLKSPWQLAELYKPGMRGAQLLLYQFEALLDYFVPDVSSHLREECVVPSMYATQWFITIFAYNFPFDIVVRVWDVFLYEGWKVVFRVAVTIIKQNRKELLSKGMEQILEYFRGIPMRLNADILMKQAFELKLKSSKLKAIERDFYKSLQSSTKP